jgi:hypothetical protein
MFAEIIPSAATSTALVAAACLIACPLLGGRTAILLAQLGAGACFALHYGLIGLWAASAVSVLGAVQTAAALVAHRMPVLERVGYALIPAMIGLGIWFWTGPSSAFAIGAMTLIAIARMRQDETELRLLLLSGTIFWTAHDAMVEAWIPLTADVIAGLFGLVALSSLLRIKNHQSPRVGPALAV